MGKNDLPNGDNQWPLLPLEAGLMLFVCRRLPANEKITSLCSLCLCGDNITLDSILSQKPLLSN